MRQIQDLRKKADLQKTDTIATLQIMAEKGLLENFVEEIKEKCGVRSVEFVLKQPKGKQMAEFTVKGKEFKVRF